MDEIVKKFEQWCEDNHVKPTDLTDKYEDLRKEEQRKREIERFESHKELLGKCYKHYNKFYKIISIKANNNARISCLIFNEHPDIDFVIMFSKGHWHSDYEGHFDFDGVYIDDVLIGTKYGTINGITDWEEITEEEFQNAYYEFCAELFNYKWEDL